MVDDPRFVTNDNRVTNHDALKIILDPIIARLNTADVMNLMVETGIPAGAVKNVEEVCLDPQVLARDMVVPLEHPTAGRVKVTGVPIKLSETPGEVQSPPPTLGQHTHEVLTSLLGYDDSDVEVLVSEGVV